MNHMLAFLGIISLVPAHLVDTKGEPVAGRWVSCQPDRDAGEPAGPEGTKARSDERGEFCVTLVPGSAAELCIWSEDGTSVVARRSDFVDGGTVLLSGANR